MRDFAYCSAVLYVAIAEPTATYNTALQYAKSRIQFGGQRSEEHTSELQSHSDLVCRLPLGKKKRGPDIIDRPSNGATARPRLRELRNRYGHAPHQEVVALRERASELERALHESRGLNRRRARSTGSAPSRPSSRARSSCPSRSSWRRRCRPTSSPTARPAGWRRHQAGPAVGACVFSQLFFLMTRPPPRSTLFPYTTLFR